MYSRLWNKHRSTLINFLDFLPGATFLIRDGNAHFFQNIHYLMVRGMLILIFLPNVPGATFIQRGTFIPESRVFYSSWTFLKMTYIDRLLLFFPRKIVNHLIMVNGLKVIFFTEKSRNGKVLVTYHMMNHSFDEL